ncbi:MAG: hydrogenase small subunit [Candidatus Omnitrophota bacterium]
MPRITRREFLERSVKLAAMMGLGATAAPRIAESLEQLAAGQAPVVWLQGQSCSGCSVSFLNADSPTPAEILTGSISLRFHSTLSTATGEIGMEIVHRMIQEGGFYLVVEGSIPAGMPEACKMGEESIASLVSRSAQKANAVIAIGACAAFGGIPAAENNPTGAVSVPRFLENEGIAKPLIRLPGCPCHPDWLTGTLVHLLQFGLPELDGFNRPKMFYGRLIHEQCPRFADYERESFAQTLSSEGCLFKLGCLGPQTHADCTLRYWNSHTNTCIKAGAPCIGCASETFASKADFPFYRKGESNKA